MVLLPLPESPVIQSVTPRCPSSRWRSARVTAPPCQVMLVENFCDIRLPCACDRAPVVATHASHSGEAENTLHHSLDAARRPRRRRRHYRRGCDPVRFTPPQTTACSDTAPQNCTSPSRSAPPCSPASPPPWRRLPCCRRS